MIIRVRLVLSDPIKVIFVQTVLRRGLGSSNWESYRFVSRSTHLAGFF